MEMPSYFIDLLAEIRPTRTQIRRMSEEHNALQELLAADDNLGPVLVTTFIQGSYRRHTSLKASEGNHCDVDVVAVTRFDRRMPPKAVLDAFVPFLEKHYMKKYKAQGRSWGIEIDEMIKLDLVPTAAPSESMLRLFEASGVGEFSESIGPWQDDITAGHTLDPIVKQIRTLREADATWQLEPLDIPDREANDWDQTHPLAQIAWTTDKNERTNGHYINVVKAVKWWRREQEPLPKYPKSYPLEHILGANCPDGIKSVAVGIAGALEEAATRYAPDAEVPRTPYLHDHGFPENERTHNVLGRLEPTDFAMFYEKLADAASIARQALECESAHESSRLWRQLFGDEFPEAPPDHDGGGDGGDEGGGKGGFSARKDVSVIGTGRFA